jgi:hypothetical protein
LTEILKELIAAATHAHGDSRNLRPTARTA